MVGSNVEAETKQAPVSDAPVMGSESPIEQSVRAEKAGTEANAPISLAHSSELSNHIVEACKASIALINSRDPKSFSGRKIDDSTAHVSWRSPDDNRRWQARCEVVDDTHLKWAAFNAFGDGKQGRWRNEDTISVSIKDGKISIDLDQSGVIQKRESYALSRLS